MSHPTVPLTFAEVVKRHAGRIALVGEDGQVLSYEQLDRARVQAGRALIALGVLSVGAAVVPVTTRMKGNEVAYVLERSGAKLLFSAGRFLDQYYPAVLAPHRPAGLKNLVVLRDAGSGDTSWQGFLV